MLLLYTMYDATLLLSWAEIFDSQTSALLLCSTTALAAAVNNID